MNLPEHCEIALALSGGGTRDSPLRPRRAELSRNASDTSRYPEARCS
jgi:hypothetical protein